MSCCYHVTLLALYAGIRWGVVNLPPATDRETERLFISSPSVTHPWLYRFLHLQYTSYSNCYTNCVMCTSNLVSFFELFLNTKLWNYCLLLYTMSFVLYERTLSFLWHTLLILAVTSCSFLGHSFYSIHYIAGYPESARMKVGVPIIMLNLELKFKHLLSSWCTESLLFLNEIVMHTITYVGQFATPKISSSKYWGASNLVHLQMRNVL